MKFNLIKYLILFLLASLSACDREQEDVKTGDIVIRLGTFSDAIDYSPYYIAREKGWFEAEPNLSQANIEHLGPFGARDVIAAAMKNGELTAVFAAVPPLIITRAGGLDLIIVENSCSLRQEIAVRQELPISSIEDLRGRQIAVLAGTSSHFGLLKVLNQNGIRESDADILYMPPPAARAAFVAGEIDAWAVWPPFIEQQQIAGRGRVVLGGDAKIHSVMATSESFANQNPEIAGALVSVIQRAKKWIQQNPEEAQQIVATHLDLPVDVVRLAWGKHNWAAGLDDDVVTDIGEKARFLAERNLTSRDRIVLASDLIDRRFAER